MPSFWRGDTILILFTINICNGMPQSDQGNLQPSQTVDVASKVYIAPQITLLHTVPNTDDISPFIHRRLSNDDIKRQLDTFEIHKQKTNRPHEFPDETRRDIELFNKTAAGQYQIYTYDNINQISPRIQNDFNYFNGIAPRIINPPNNGDSKFPSYPNFHIAPKIQNGYSYMNVHPNFDNVNVAPNVNNKMDTGSFNLRINNNKEEGKEKETKEQSEIDPILTNVLLRQNEIAEKLVSYLEDNYKQMLELRSQNEFADLMKDMTTKVATTSQVTTSTTTVFPTETHLIDKTQIKEALRSDPLVKRVLQIMKNKKEQFLKDN